MSDRILIRLGCGKPVAEFQYRDIGGKGYETAKTITLSTDEQDIIGEILHRATLRNRLDDFRKRKAKIETERAALEKTLSGATS